MKDKSRRISHWVCGIALACVVIVNQAQSREAAAHPTLLPQVEHGGTRIDAPGNLLDGTQALYAARGGRGPKHCALSLGVVAGGLLGLFVNPVVATAFIRFGMVAAVLHC